MTERIVELASQPVEVAPGRYVEPHECGAADLLAAAELLDVRASDLQRDARLYRNLAERA